MDVAEQDWTCFYGAGWGENRSLVKGLTAVWLCQFSRASVGITD